MKTTYYTLLLILGVNFSIFSQVFDDEILIAEGLEQNNYYRVFSHDLDGDGDMDAMVAASLSDDILVWFENTDGNGNFAPSQVLLSNIAIDNLHFVDLDGDGDMDLVPVENHPNGVDQIVWYENTDGNGSFGPQQIITTLVDGLYTIGISDIDNDGDLDIASASRYDDKVAWYENTDGNGNFGPQQVITTNLDGPRTVNVADLDGDGDTDVLATSINGNIVWFENTDGLGDFGPQQIITTGLNGYQIQVTDIDGDGDNDVLSTSSGNIVWFENTDGLGNFGPQQATIINGYSFQLSDFEGDGDLDIFTKRSDGYELYQNLDGNGSFAHGQLISYYSNNMVLTDIDGDGKMNVLSITEVDFMRKLVWLKNNECSGVSYGNEVTTADVNSLTKLNAADLDGDGDIDVLSASAIGGGVAWYENMDGQGNFGSQQLFESLTAYDVGAADLDGDGDIDVFAWYTNRLVWYENDGMGNFGADQIIRSEPTGAESSVFAIDIDGDNDKDILSFNSLFAKITWFENTDGLGNFGTEQVIVGSLDPSNSLNLLTMYPADIDMDGDIDLVATDFIQDVIMWFENTDGAGNFGPQQFIYNSQLTRVIFPADIDGDGDTDLLGRIDGNLGWLKNIDGSGSFELQTLIIDEDPNSIYTTDLDNDGDLDVVATVGVPFSRLVWFENMDGLGNFSFEKAIKFYGTRAHAADIDGDGEMDVLSGANNFENRILWYENKNMIDIEAPVPDVNNLPNITSECLLGSLTPPTSTDNCGGSITGTTTTIFPITESTTVTWNYVDNSNNSSSQNQDVIIDDTVAPLPDVSILTAITAQCEAISITAPTASDNCAGSIIGTTTATFPITTSQVMIWTFVDGNGNSATQNQDIIVNDTEAPTPDVATLPAVNGQCEVAAVTAPTATDNCNGIITGTTTATFPINSTQTITWSFVDSNNNTSTQNQDIIVNDTEAPTPDVATLPAVNGQCEVTSITAPTATDNCNGIITGTTTASFPINLTQTITWSFVDSNNNTSTQNQDIIVNDTEAPTPDVTTLPSVLGQCEVAAVTAPTATDTCNGTITGTTTAVFPINTTQTITWFYDDGNGNVSSQDQEIVVDDTIAPVPDAATLPVVNAQCEVASVTAPTATDTCNGTITGTTTAVFPINTTQTIIWSFVDANGNSATQNQDVVLNDTTNPTVIGMNPTGNLNGFPSVTIPVTSADNGSFDNCGIATLTLTPNTFTAIGTYAAVLEGTDTSGNTNNVPINITIIDTVDSIPPTAICQNLTAQLDPSGMVTITGMNVDGGSTDNIGIASLTVSPDSFNCANTGANTVTLTVTDASGNQDTCTAIITVIDNLSPTAMGMNIEVNLAGNPSISIIPADVDNGSTDNCSIVQRTLSQDAFTNIGVFDVDLFVEDNSGNIGETTVQVTVVDILSISASLVNQFLIYPNPAKNEVTISGGANSWINRIDIFDINGRLVYKKKALHSNEQIVDLSPFASGMYLITIYDIDSNPTIKKLIKE